MKKLLTTPLAIAVLLVLAVGLIGYGGINAVAAAPRIQSNLFGAEVELTDISTSLVETNAGHEKKTVASADVTEPLLEGLVPAGEIFPAGAAYAEELAVPNDGDIPQYVRVTVFRYWTDDNGKDVSLDPGLIDIAWNEGPWVIDTAASTDERVVLYYQSILAPGDTSEALTKSVTVSPNVLAAMTEGEYRYDGVTFHVKARVDAVQDHNGTQAMTGAWGRTI